LYGSALILAAYWYVTISHLLRARITIPDLGKSIRWLWCLASGDLTREVILDPIVKVPNPENESEK